MFKKCYHVPCDTRLMGAQGARPCWEEQICASCWAHERKRVYRSPQACLIFYFDHVTLSLISRSIWLTWEVMTFWCHLASESRLVRQARDVIFTYSMRPSILSGWDNYMQLVLHSSNWWSLLKTLWTAYGDWKTDNDCLLLEKTCGD